ncbi:MAG TPA: hypothetical protein VJT74_01785 [Pyrinomonadaceae bacterium]|nr:hypothetical protein [Pyrinomonadaceae bacterium]
MRRILLVGLMVPLLTSIVYGQKGIFGDSWTGEVVATDEATREITIKSAGKNKTETFTGVLEEGYKVKMKDGSQHELKVSEIPPGTRIRVFFKSQDKVNRIRKVVFLGIDEYTKLREAVHAEPSTPVTLAESEKFPASDPLKIYVAVAQPYLKDSFVEWADRWNKKEAAKYGSIEVVNDAAGADISLVTYWGRDESEILLPLTSYERGGTPHNLVSATAQIVAREGGGLKVLWQKLMFLSPKKLGDSAWPFDKEVEKRMKARRKK